MPHLRISGDQWPELIWKVGHRQTFRHMRRQLICQCREKLQDLDQWLLRSGKQVGVNSVAINLEALVGRQPQGTDCVPDTRELQGRRIAVTEAYKDRVVADGSALPHLSIENSHGVTRAVDGKQA